MTGLLRPVADRIALVRVLRGARDSAVRRKVNAMLLRRGVDGEKGGLGGWGAGGQKFC